MGFRDRILHQAASQPVPQPPPPAPVALLSEKALWKLPRAELNAVAVKNNVDPTKLSTDAVIVALKKKGLVG